MILKKLATIFLILILASCKTNKTVSPNEDLTKFNEYLGLSKADALNQAVNSFDNFLLTNYPNDKEKKRILKFLDELKVANENGKPNNNWILDTKSNKEFIKTLETSGMRNEIQIYGYENYKVDYLIDSLYSEEDKRKNEDIVMGVMNIDEMIIEDSIQNIGRDTTGDAEFYRISEEQNKLLVAKMDSNLSFNPYGQFLYGLAKQNQDDTLIQKYIDIRRLAGDLSYYHLFDIYFQKDIDLNNPFIKRMFIVDFYLDLVRWDIRNSNK